MNKMKSHTLYEKRKKIKKTWNFDWDKQKTIRGYSINLYILEEHHGSKRALNDSRSKWKEYKDRMWAKFFIQT